MIKTGPFKKTKEGEGNMGKHTDKNNHFRVNSGTFLKRRPEKHLFHGNTKDQSFPH